MDPNVPKPMFFGLDPVGALICYFSKKHICPQWGPKCVPYRALRVQDGSILGPGDPEASTDPPTDELSGPNQGPLPSRPGKKYVAQGTLADIGPKNIGLGTFGSIN